MLDTTKIIFVISTLTGEYLPGSETCLVPIILLLSFRSVKNLSRLLIKPYSSFLFRRGGDSFTNRRSSKDLFPPTSIRRRTQRERAHVTREFPIPRNKRQSKTKREKYTE